MTLKEAVNGYRPYTLLLLFRHSVVSNCNPMDCSMPGFPVLHHFLELAQTHIDQVGDTIQPSCLLSSPSPPAFNLSQHQGLFNEPALCIRWPKYWSFGFSISPSNEYSRFISFRSDWFDLLAVQGILKSSPTPQLESINSSALSLFYGPTLTSILDTRKTIAFNL